MAIFNPDVGNVPNDNMPNFFKYSDSISQPKADESRGIALKTTGEALEGGVKIADTVVKDTIKSDVYNRVDAERDAFSDALTNTKNYGSPTGPQPNSPSPVGDYGPNPTPVDLMGNTKPTVPGAIDGGLGKIQTAQAALDGNKISETTYYQRLNTVAKDLRATYPGYRDYIDQEISKTTGVNPANAYVSSIIQDLNRQGTNAQKETEFWEHQIVSNAGFPDADKMLQNYKKTGDSNRVMQWLNYNQGAVNILNLKKAAYESQTNDRATQVQAGEDYANSAAMHAATNYFYNTQKFSNGDVSPAQIADQMADLSLHPEKANDVAYQGLAERYAALHTQAYNQTMRLLTQPTKGPDGKLIPPVSDTIGAEKTKAIVDKTVGSLFQATRDFIADKQFSPAYSVQTAAAAVANNAYYRVLTNPSIAGVVQTASALNKAAPNFTPFMSSGALSNNLDTDLGKFVQEQGKQAIAQTGGSYNGIDGKVYTFKQSLEEQEKAASTSGKPITGQAPANLLTLKGIITDPKSTPEGRSNAIKYFYDPAGKGALDKMMDDYYDPSKGGVVKGRTSAFSVLYGEDVTKAVWEHGKGVPGDWVKYSQSAKDEAAKQIRTTVADLNQIQSDYENRSSNGLPGSQVKVAWDNEKHQVKLLNHDGTSLDVVQDSVAGMKLRNMNTYLTSLATIAKTEGSNVDAFVFKTMKNAGWNPTKDIDGVPAQLMRGMIVSNGGKVAPGPVAPTVPVSRFAPEDVRGDLQSFLTHPAGPNGLLEASGTQTYQTRGVIHGNLSDEKLLNMRTDDIPEGMSARDFIRQLKAGR